MITHVHNPYTRSPRLRVSLTAEEAQQLYWALVEVYAQFGSLINEHMDHNQRDALHQLKQVLQDAGTHPPPRGLKGFTP